MANIRIITDAAGDVSPENAAKYNIRVIPFQVALGEKSYVTPDEVDNEHFYELMAQVDEIPKTAQVTPFEFTEIYEQEAQAGYTDLVLILINAKGSATHGNSLLAIEQFLEDHPEYEGKVHIHSYDGIGYSAHYGAPAVEAAKMAAEGTGIEAVTAYLDSILPRRQVFFGMYALKYAAKSGRIPSAAAFLGDKLGLKPVMKIADNEIVTAAKVRGEKALISKLAELSVQAMEPGTPYEVIYGSDPSTAEDMAQAMTAKVGYGPDGAYQISAVIAANAGPKVAGVAFTRK